MERVSQRAVSKAILAGEHFVVHGSPALAIPIPSIYLKCHFLSHSSQNQKLPSLIQKGLEICAKKLGPLPGKWSVEIESNIPLASGMGSSAALSVALVKAYGEVLGRNISKKEIFEISMEMETLAHGKASGIDSTVITYEKPIYFRIQEDPIFFQGPQKIGIIIINTNQPSSTRKTVAKVQEFRRSHPKRFEKIAQQARDLVESFYQALLKGDIKDIGKLAQENHSLLKEIGVYSSVTDQAQKAALQAGALGAKMSGGGGGGIVLAFSDPEEKEKIFSRLKEQGFSPIEHLLF